MSVVNELQTRATFLKERWAALSSKSGLELEVVDAALVLCEKIDSIIVERNLEPQTRPDDQNITPAELHQRAFTGCVKAYGQSRRVVRYVRYDENDADILIPSLYSVGRSGHKQAQEQTTANSPTLTSADAPVDAPLPASPEPVPGGPGGNPFKE
jgi:hypothetical protein